jgi:palmitoyl-protein thioesterase
MAKLTKELGEKTGDYSVCVEIGNGSVTSLAMDFANQVLEACENVKNDPRLAGQTINVVGLSQGALIARSIAENCDFGGKVSKLLSIGGPNMGVSAFPKCEGGIMCYPINTLTKSLVYTSFAQSNIGPAGYFRDVKNLPTYLKKSHFLPDLNNERSFSQERKDRV